MPLVCSFLRVQNCRNGKNGSISDIRIRGQKNRTCREKTWDFVSKAHKTICRQHIYPEKAEVYNVCVLCTEITDEKADDCVIDNMIELAADLRCVSRLYGSTRPLKENDCK